MAEVYKFKVKLREPEDKIWRDIELTSTSSVAKLGYAILASFEAEGIHLFCIKFKGDRYEIVNDDFYDKLGIKTMDPIFIKLSSLKMEIGDTMELEYDYGVGWFFDIELICVKPMAKGTGNYYPYVTDGAGLGIIEGLYADEWAEYIKTVDETGVPPIYYDVFDKEVTWDYRKFDIDITNALLKGTVKRMKRIYEDLFE
ncbi:MAG: plasmid pRiA4b ORF-3 family protein [Clostridia bacterium]